MEQLYARLNALEEKSAKQEAMIAEFSKEKDTTDQIFDCSTKLQILDGIIAFDGCSVDTTAGAPVTGTFTVQDPGIYRFTFIGRVYLLSYAPANGRVLLRVDGEAVATADAFWGNYGYNDDNFGVMVAINTIQELNAGQSVTIEWNSGNGTAWLGPANGSGGDGGQGLPDWWNDNDNVHFTGQQLLSLPV